MGLALFALLQHLVDWLEEPIEEELPAYLGLRPLQSQLRSAG